MTQEEAKRMMKNCFLNRKMVRKANNEKFNMNYTTDKVVSSYGENLCLDRSSGSWTTDFLVPVGVVFVEWDYIRHIAHPDTSYRMYENDVLDGPRDD